MFRPVIHRLFLDGGIKQETVLPCRLALPVSYREVAISAFRLSGVQGLFAY